MGYLPCQARPLTLGGHAGDRDAEGDSIEICRRNLKLSTYSLCGLVHAEAECGTVGAQKPTQTGEFRALVSQGLNLRQRHYCAPSPVSQGLQEIISQALARVQLSNVLRPKVYLATITSPSSKPVNLHHG